MKKRMGKYKCYKNVTLCTTDFKNHLKIGMWKKRPFLPFKIVDNLAFPQGLSTPKGEKQGITRVFLWITLWIMWKSPLKTGIPKWQQNLPVFSIPGKKEERCPVYFGKSTPKMTNLSFFEGNAFGGKL